MKCLLCERHYKKTPHVFEYYMVNIQEPLFLPQQINTTDKKKMCGMCVCVCVYTMEYYLAIKKEDSATCKKKKWMELKGIMLGEINQAEKDTV